MRTKGDGRFVLGAICLVLFLALGIGEAAGATYYASPSGTNTTTCSSGDPCSLATGLKKLAAGDTLVLKDGTYYSGINVPISGTSGNRITIKAENDGQAIVNGNGLREPLVISGKKFVNVEGIVFVNSNTDVIKVSGSSYINLSRLSAYNAGIGNHHLFLIWNSHNVVVEDCVASQGTEASSAGRYCFVSHGGAHDNIFRRNYCKYFNHTGGGGPCAAFADYGGSYDLWENNIGDVSEMSSSCSNCCRYGIYGPGMYNDTSHNTWKGNVLIGGPSVPQAALFGPVDQSTSDWSFTDNVIFGFGSGIYQQSSDSYPSTNCTYNNNTIVTSLAGDAMLTLYGGGATATATNNIFLKGSTALRIQAGNSLKHVYNKFYDVTKLYSGTSAGTGEATVNPSYNTSTYGNGAYLMVPSALQGQGESGADIGAEVLYRYKDGVLTNEPLWPWPMEERIFKETGISVTWESNGGLWKTLNGVYVNAPVPVPAPQPSDTISPSTPNGLVASAVSSTQINLSWTASIDNVGVAGYKVYRNGTQIATTKVTSYANSGLTPSTTYTYKVSAYDAAGNNSPQSGSVSATTQGSRSPYPGPGAVSVPGIIEAENFDNGGEGVSYHDVTSNNEGGAYRQTGVDIEACSEGGYNVGWIRAGEWLEYTINVPAAGTYDIEARVAAASGAGGNFHIEFDGVNKTGSMSIPSTGGWQNWTTVKKSGVSLSAGQQIMRVVFDTETGQAIGNVNYMKLSFSGILPAPRTRR